MRLTLALTAAGVALVLSASPATAQCCTCPIPPPQAPNTYGPCYFAVNCCGALYGPNYCLRPCYPPFQGMVFPPKPPGKKGHGMQQAGGPSPEGGFPPQGGPGFAPPGVGGVFPPAQAGPLAGPGPGAPGYPGMPPMGVAPPGPGAAYPPMMLPYPPKGPIEPPRFVNHPFARGPRDFFMME